MSAGGGVWRNSWNFNVCTTIYQSNEQGNNYMEVTKPSQKKGKLWNNCCYLVGPIDKCPEGGATWRKQVKNTFGRLGMDFLDPTDKPNPKLNEIQQKIQELNVLKAEGKYDELAERVKLIRSFDLRCVDKADFIIAYMNNDIQMTGTIEEIVTANREKKPVLIVCEQGKKEIPNWMFGMLPHYYFFNNWAELEDYVVGIDNGSIEPDKRWWFLNE